MSTPSQPRPTDEQNDPAQPSTREIPVVAPAGIPPEAAVPASPLPPHPGATAHVPVAAQPTGPVGFVPGPPPSPGGPPPASGPAAGATAVSAAPTWPDTLESEETGGDRRRLPAPRLQGAFAGIGLSLLGLVLLELGLLPAGGSRSLWSGTPLWSAFATLAALATLAASIDGSSGSAADGGRSGMLRRAAVAGAAGVAVFWLLVVLPDAASNRGFVLTAAAACLGAGAWLGSHRTN